MPPVDRLTLSQELLLAAIGDGWPQAQVDTAAELLASNGEGFRMRARHLPRELVNAVQRERLVAAMVRASAELGYRRLNVQDVLDQAGVTRPLFYEHFANKEDCFIIAFDSAAEWLCERVEAAALAGGEVWLDRIRLGLQALLRFAATEPNAARLLIEARIASADAMLRHSNLIDHFARCLDAQARELLPEGRNHSTIAAAAIAGGVETLLHSRLEEGRSDDIESLLPSLVYFVVGPYQGHAAAGKKLPAR